MLQHRLLVQLHTYVCLMASPSEEDPHPREDDVPFTARVGGRSLSTPNALSFGSPSRSPLPRASVWWVGVAFGGVLGSGSQDPDMGSAGRDQGRLPWPRAEQRSLEGGQETPFPRPLPHPYLTPPGSGLLGRGWLESRAAREQSRCPTSLGGQLSPLGWGLGGDPDDHSLFERATAAMAGAQRTQPEPQARGKRRAGTLPGLRPDLGV